MSISIAYNEANVKVCGLYAGLTAEKNGGTHIGVEDVALMRSIPNMCVIEPAGYLGVGSGRTFFGRNMKGRCISGSRRCT